MTTLPFVHAHTQTLVGEYPIPGATSDYGASIALDLTTNILYV